jgi:hypothetical protein
MSRTNKKPLQTTPEGAYLKGIEFLMPKVHVYISMYV